MAIKSLQVLYLGSDYLDESRITSGVAPGRMVETVFLAFLIRADEGNILVDTGFHPDDAAEENAKMGLQINVKPQDALPCRLKEVGLSMDDVNMVVMTHLDQDHIGFLADLQHADVVLQKEEYDYALDPPPYARRRFHHPERFNSPQIKWRLVKGDNIVMPGLAVLLTPGHTPGSQSVMVNLPKFGPLLLAGDVGRFKRDFDEELVPTGQDLRQAYYSIKRLNVLSQMINAPIFPSHDINLWRRDMLKPPEAYT